MASITVNSMENFHLLILLGNNLFPKIRQSKTMKEYVALISPIIGSFMGLIGVVLLYSIQRGLRKDQLSKALREFHINFWNDVDMKEVRSWIALDAAYENVKNIYKKRLENTCISINEYEILEKTDKFAALIGAYKVLNNKDKLHSSTSELLFDSYWIKEINNERRPELKAYIKKFFPQLFE